MSEQTIWHCMLVLCIFVKIISLNLGWFWSNQASGRVNYKEEEGWERDPHQGGGGQDGGRKEESKVNVVFIFIKFDNLNEILKNHMYWMYI